MLAFIIAADMASGIAGAFARFIRWCIPTRKEMRRNHNKLVTAPKANFIISLVLMLGVSVLFAFALGPFGLLGGLIATGFMFGRAALHR